MAPDGGARNREATGAVGVIDALDGPRQLPLFYRRAAGLRGHARMPPDTMVASLLLRFFQKAISTPLRSALSPFTPRTADPERLVRFRSRRKLGSSGTSNAQW